MIDDALFPHHLPFPPEGLTDAWVGADGEVSPAAREAIRKQFPAGGGVYLLSDGEDRLVQLAAAGSLRRALTARLLGGAAPTAESEAGDSAAPGTEPTTTAGPAEATDGPPRPTGMLQRLRLHEVVRHIRWHPAHSPFELSLTYWRLARVLMPRNYREALAFGAAWMVHVDPDAPIPRFVVTRTLPAEPGTVIGPFATQADGARFVQILEDTFELCRYHHILEQTPHGQACAYFEMGRCPAPCDGTVPMSHYRGMIAVAERFARGQRDEALASLQAEMRAAAAELAFERAGALRQRIERAGEIDHRAFRLTRPVERFNFLIVQRGRTRSRVRPFFVRGGAIAAGDETRMAHLERALPDWIERVRPVSGEASRSTMPPDGDAARLASEQIWLVSHFLFKESPAGVFLDADTLGDADEVRRRIRAGFAARGPASRGGRGA